ncbi:histidine phosphatase family protein [Rhodococcus sp. NPDC058521]|uniref:histidine phosphatase family protein n=1 Tax=Rhodococcus sp. NPDC058521 TaxID=3346536 RepID=UPI0036550E40
MSGKLILVRHGQTVANVAKRLDTRLPGAPLTTEGLAQAELFGRNLAARRTPATLVSSLALRARQTAGFVESASGVAAQLREGIHEAQAGELEDRSDRESHDLFVKTFHQWHTGDLSAHVPGGESGYDVLDRYVPVLTALRDEFLGDPASGDVVVVSHGAAIRLVGAHLSGVPGLFAANNHLSNTQTVELVPAPDGGWECVRWGSLEPPFEHTVIPGADDPMG